MRKKNISALLTLAMLLSSNATVSAHADVDGNKQNLPSGSSQVQTNQTADFFAPQPASNEEFDAIAKSGLKADIHAKNLEGAWSKQTVTLTKSSIHTISIINQERTIGIGYINSSCYPKGYITYSTIFDGAENAKPSYSNLDDVVSASGEKPIGGGTVFDVSKNQNGSWSFGYQKEGADFWCTEMLPYSLLKDVVIKFHSVESNKTYEIQLKENTYEGVILDDQKFQGYPVYLTINLRLEEYQKELSSLTGNDVTFGGTDPVKESANYGQPNNLRQISLQLDTDGTWTNPGSSYNINGLPEEGNNGIAFSEKIETDASKTVMHRLYNPNSGEHFYTAADNEKDHLVSVGWKYEGEGWKAPDKSNAPVYRLYNPNAGDHHYTLNEKEKDALVKLGWNYEGIGWYSDENKAVPLYREYNPNAKAGSHNYTPNKNEHDHLTSIGWKDEGIAWYGLK